MVVAIVMTLAILITMVIGGTALFRYYQTPKAVEAPKRQRTEYDCELFTTRLFEQRLIDEGIETTLSKCDDIECVTCHPKRELRTKSEIGKLRNDSGIKLRTPIYNDQSFCNTCSTTVSAGRDECVPCVKNRHEYIKKNKEPRRKVVEHNGQYYSVYLPTEVPDYAHVEIADRDFMGYPTSPPFAQAHLKWTDPKTGQTKGLRATATQVEKYEVHVDQYSKPVNEFYSGEDILKNLNNKLDVLDEKIARKEVELDQLFDAKPTRIRTEKVRK